MIRYSKVILLLLLAGYFSPLLAQPSNIFDIESSKKYAEHLFSSGNFQEAATEYERLILIDTAHASNYKLVAVQSYRLAQNLDVGFKRFNAWFNDDQKQQFPVNREFSLYLIGLGFYNDALAFLEGAQGMEADDKNTLIALSHSFLAEWKEASEALLKLNESNATSTILEQVAKDGNKLRFKKPGLAAVLSIVPGLGRVYTGNYADAGISALTITTIAWQAYTGFDKNGTRSFYGWLTATLATAFYFGNIYGSYRSAQLYNKQKMDALYAEILRAYKLVD